LGAGFGAGAFALGGGLLLGAGGAALGAAGGFADGSGLLSGGDSRHFRVQASDAFLHSSTHRTTWSQAKSQSVSMVWQRVSHSCTPSGRAPALEDA